jgi:O-antigen/teichoic acid export membrane protein
MSQEPQKRLQRLLRWGELRTRTDLSYVFRNGTWLTIGQVIVALTAFLLSIAFAHFVSKNTYGTYRYLLSILWIVAAFSFTGLPTAVTQAVARGFEGAYRKSFRLGLIWSFPMALIAFGTSAYYLFVGNTELGYGLLVIGLLGPLMQPSLLYAAFLEGKKDFRRYALYGFILAIVPAVLALGAMFILPNPLTFLIVYLVGNVGTGFFFDYLVFRIYKPSHEVNPELQNLGLHFSAMNILAALAQQVDKISVYHYLGATELAIYSFAIALPEQIKGVFNNVATIAFPKFSNRSLEDIKTNFWGRMGLYTLILIVIAVLYILAAPLIFHTFFPEYADAIVYSQIFAVSLVVISNTVPLTLLQAHAAKRELYIFNIVSPVIQIVSLIFFTICWGLLGTVLARILTRAVNVVLLAGLVELRTISVKNSLKSEE